MQFGQRLLRLRPKLAHQHVVSLGGGVSQDEAQPYLHTTPRRGTGGALLRHVDIAS